MVFGYRTRVDMNQGRGDLAGPAHAIKERCGPREGEDLEEGSTVVVGKNEAVDPELESRCDDV